MFKKSKIFILFICCWPYFCSPDRNIYKNEYYSARNDHFRWYSDDKYSLYYKEDDQDYYKINKYENENYRNFKYNNDSNYNSDYSKSDVKQNINNSQKSNKNIEKPKIKSYDIKDQKNIIEKKIYTYRVKKGDSLIKIARVYKISIDKLCIANKIKNKNDIKLGMILNIPLYESNIKSDNIVSDRNQHTNPKFRWPLNSIINTRRDCQDGVNPIGVIITGKSSSPVFSSASGTVKKIGSMRGYGKYIIVKHQDRFLTIYSNMKKIIVSEGEKVRAGKTLGILDGDKLHFQIDYSGKPEDPLYYLSKKS